MSETLTTFEFTHTTSNLEERNALSEEVMAAVATEGAAAVHNFLPIYHLQRAARSLYNEPWQTDESHEHGAVERHHDLIEYGFLADYPWPTASAGRDYAPEPVFNASRRITEFVASAPSAEPWSPTEIMAHRYKPEDFIARHRDYARALGYVAVLTLEGSQVFSFERDSGEVASVDMQPGTLTIMRGYQPSTAKPRPYHWVEAATEDRFAISLREMRKSW